MTRARTLCTGMVLLLTLSTSVQAQSLTPTIIAVAQAQAEADAYEVARAIALDPPSKDSRSHEILRAAILIVAAGLDIHSTLRATRTPGIGEKNSWLYGKRPTLGRMLIVKSVTNGALLYAAHKTAEKTGRVEGMMPVAIAGAKQAAAAILNYKLMAKQRTRNAGGR